MSFCGLGINKPPNFSYSHLDRHEVVMVSVRLCHLQDQAGLLAHEGLAGHVGDGGYAAEAGGV